MFKQAFCNLVKFTPFPSPKFCGEEKTVCSCGGKVAAPATPAAPTMKARCGCGGAHKH